MKKNILKYLSEIIVQIDEFILFSSQPIDDNFSTETYIEIFNTQFYNVVSEIVESLHFSLLSGEYYELNLRNKDEIESQEKELRDKIIELENTLKSKKANRDKDINELVKIIDNYFYFIKILSASLTEHSTSYIYTKLDSLLEHDKSIFDKVFELKDDYWVPKIINGIEYHNFIFNISLQISLFDEGYICDIKTLHFLIELSNKINLIRLLNTDVVELIKDKLQWLIYKLLYRLKKTEYISEYITFDEIAKKDIIYKLSKDGIKNNVFYEYYKNDLERCYPDKKSIVTNNSERLKEILFSEELITIKDIHYLSKTIKNDDKYILFFNEFSIDKVNSNLLKCKNNYYLKYNYCDNEFDKYAYYSAIGLLTNIIFKIYFDGMLLSVKNNLEIDKINNEIYSLKTRITLEENLQKDISGDRVQSSFQLIRICTKGINQLILDLRIRLEQYNYEEKNKKELLKLIENIRELIEITTNKILEIKQNIKSSKQGRWMPIYLLKEDCIISNDKIKQLKNIDGVFPDTLLLDSSYILPSNYNILDKLLSEDIDKLTVNDFIFRGIVSVKILDTYDIRLKNEVEKVIQSKKETEANVNEILKNNNSEFNSKVKDSQMNAIQYLGLYAGIITFVLSSVSIVPKFDYSYSNILLFMFSIASCLCLFVFLLRFLFVESARTVSILCFKNIGLRNVIAFLLFGLIFGISIIGIYINRKDNINTRFNNVITTKTFLKDTLNKVCTDTSISVIETKGNYFPKLDEPK